MPLPLNFWCEAAVTGRALRTFLVDRTSGELAWFFSLGTDWILEVAGYWIFTGSKGNNSKCYVLEVFSGRLHYSLVSWPPSTQMCFKQLF